MVKSQSHIKASFLHTFDFAKIIKINDKLILIFGIQNFTSFSKYVGSGRYTPSLDYNIHIRIKILSDTVSGSV